VGAKPKTLARPIHIGLVIVALWIALCISAALPPWSAKVYSQAPAAKEAPIRLAIAKWQRRRELVRTARYVLTGHRLDVKGAQNDILPPSARLKGDVPSEDRRYRLNYEWLVDFQKKQIKKTTETEAFSGADLAYVPYYEVCALAGGRFKCFFPPKKNTSPSWASKKHPDMYIEPKDYSEVFFAPNTYPILFSLGSVPTPNARPDPADLLQPLAPNQFTFVESRRQDGREYAVLKASNGPTAWEYWVDLSRDGAITQHTMVVNGFPMVRTAVEYKQVAAGWFPSSWTTDYYFNPGELNHSEEATLTELSINCDLSTDDMSIQPKPGTLVGDRSEGPVRLGRVNDNGAIEEVKYETPAVSNANIWLIIILVLLGVIGAYLYRRSQRRGSRFETSGGGR
jgi:hypothetical protein